MQITFFTQKSLGIFSYDLLSSSQIKTLPHDTNPKPVIQEKNGKNNTGGGEYSLIYRSRYIGMCGPEGYGFLAVLVINRVSILAILVIRDGFCTLVLKCWYVFL